jgi:hypothetical protein
MRTSFLKTMEQRVGPIRKMHTKEAQPVSYTLPIGDATVQLNPYIGKPVRLRHTGRIFCIHCGKAPKTSFAQGYCYPCMQPLAQCDLCIVKPETCHHHLGTCREPEWGEAHCMIEHTVYLANSSGIKVGITRSHQMTTRWMDQGAVQALPIVKVRSRRESGLVEFALSRTMPDKTNWRLMLKDRGEYLNLQAKRDELFAAWPENLPGEWVTGGKEFEFVYPVLRYPGKLKAFNLDKQPDIQGVLLGIKGQYLIFEDGVLNLRKHGGYELEWQPQETGESDPVEVKMSAGFSAATENTGLGEQIRLL